jgi:hypothetical protein
MVFYNTLIYNNGILVHDANCEDWIKSPGYI